MSTLYVNTIYPQSGTTTAISGNLEVSGTIDAYEFKTIVETTYRGSTIFGNDTADTHQITGSVYMSGSGLEIRGPEAGTAIITLKADQGDDTADKTTLSVADGGDFTITSGADIVLNPAGGDVLPNADNTRNLGSSSKRWANVYTGDLHLKNDRGDWTILEEADYLCVVNNATGKKFKMMLQEIDE